MKKDLGIVQGIFPMPVLMVAAYDEQGTPNVLNAAWGTMCDEDKLLLVLDEGHKTTKNILHSKAFSVSLADAAHIEAADFFGIASGNRMPDKFARSGCTVQRSTFVNAPVIEEFPLVMECELAEVVQTPHLYCIIGRIVNTAAEERLLAENGKIAPEKLDALLFDPFQHGYYGLGQKLGRAWNAGKRLMKEEAK